MNGAMIFDIQRFCLHDGPGIRTVVFFKGCPLQCPWCCNPESQSPAAQLLFHAQRCLGCGRCVPHCEHGALHLSGERVALDRSVCVACGSCAAECPSEALSLCGRDMDAQQLLQIVEADRLYYDMSGGGVTFSGGEATMQAPFLLELLALCRERKLNTALETCGVCDEEAFARLCALCDGIYFDLKAPTREEYQSALGNGQPFGNLLCAARTGRCIVRIPLIPGFNTDKAQAFAAALKPLPVQGVEVLPYHRLGSGKYAKLGRTYALDALLPPSDAVAEDFRARLQQELFCPVTIRK